MVVLLTGASGFIGSRLVNVLIAQGHEVICAVRQPKQPDRQGIRYVQADFTRDFEPADWIKKLSGVDAVINAVGIIQERGSQTFEAIHYRAPRALFAACAEAGVQRIIQISALGADAQAQSRYHLSKKQVDDFLASLPVPSAIVQPSLVYGREGASARMFTTLASLPVIPLPGKGCQQVQPVLVDDVVDAIAALLKVSLTAHSVKMSLVGPRQLAFREFLAILRSAMALSRPRFIAVPHALMRIAAAANKLIPGSLLDTETLQMLERGNTADTGPIQQLLGRKPTAPEDFIAKSESDAAALQAKLRWLLPMLRIGISSVWIWTGIVSFGVFPVEESYQLLAKTGVTGALAPVMLYGAAALDMLFGIATLALKRRRWLWLAQISLILLYTIIITIKLPEFWLHPYGPLIKNIPMLLAIYLLLELE